MSKEKEVIKEIHHYHYIPYPAYMPYSWQYPWYPRAPGYPGYIWCGPTSIEGGTSTGKLSGNTVPTSTTTWASTTGKGTTIKYGTNINQLS